RNPPVSRWPLLAQSKLRMAKSSASSSKNHDRKATNPMPKKKPSKKQLSSSSSAGPNNPITIQSARQQLNIVVDHIPLGHSNRPGTPLSATKITIHNTDNASP